MSDSAQRRLQALGKQLDAPPPIKVAGPSAGPRVPGKVVIITAWLTIEKGANSILGIGRASAHQFAENGARAIYLCDYADDNLESHKTELGKLYPKVDVHTRKFDAADESAVKDVVSHAVTTYDRLDIFFANAGITGPHNLFTEITEEDFMQNLRTNVLSVFLAAKHSAPAMQKTSAEKKNPGGSIILTASVAGIRSNAGTTPYSASKAAVISLAQTIAYQAAGTNVRVNAICPGLIETGMTSLMYDTARARGTQNRIGQINPMKRGGHADEIARVALFLGSDESSYVNGQAWAVDGGLSAGHPYVVGKLA
ncbi:3-oxoacyl-[acyl-carrier-protein] reductase 3 [Colletotrichum chlorophyti]|uniref:3-oxoacyl-[acyl-carrier-protein] reductase 3 n=1 Tax=Colletotrichum chlorophyti TaxID=708187 RepID=A0A1Q8RYI9_9PEZI|nr:3-oxoacyl-[acyl-carrier-protein] reductase 3 [Colletotrichum chlorophyti]